MSTVIRAYGANFDVDAFLVDCSLPICAIKRRGEAVLPASQPGGRTHEKSGVHVSFDVTDFDKLSQQVAQAIIFLQKEEKQLLRLCEFPGVEIVILDFGVARRDSFVQSDYFPPVLVRLAASLGMGMELSRYPIADSS